MSRLSSTVVLGLAVAMIGGCATPRPDEANKADTTVVADTPSAVTIEEVIPYRPMRPSSYMKGSAGPVPLKGGGSLSQVSVLQLPSGPARLAFRIDRPRRGEPEAIVTAIAGEDFSSSVYVQTDGSRMPISDREPSYPFFLQPQRDYVALEDLASDDDLTVITFGIEGQTISLEVPVHRAGHPYVSELPPALLTPITAASPRDVRDPSRGDAVPFIVQPYEPEVATDLALRTFTATLVLEKDCLYAQTPSGVRALFAASESNARWDPDAQALRIGKRSAAVGAEHGFQGQVFEPINPAPLPEAQDIQGTSQRCPFEAIAFIEDIGESEAEIRDRSPYDTDLDFRIYPAVDGTRIEPEQLCRVQSSPVQPLPSNLPLYTVYDDGRSELYSREYTSLRCMAPQGDAIDCVSDSGGATVFLRRGDRMHELRSLSDIPLRISARGDTISCQAVRLRPESYTRKPLVVAIDARNKWSDPALTQRTRPMLIEMTGAISETGCLTLTDLTGEDHIAVFPRYVGWSELQSEIQTGPLSYAGDLSFSGVPSIFEGWVERSEELKARCGTDSGFFLADPN